MMTRAHERYNRLFRQTHKTFQIHHLALLMFKDYIMILDYIMIPGIAKNTDNTLDTNWH